MSNKFTAVSYIDTEGKQQELNLDLSMYQEAQDKGMSFSAFVNNKYPTDASAYGSTFAQFARSCGLYLSDDPQYGIRAPSIKAIMDGTAHLAAASITRPDGSQSQTPAGRLLFPSVLIDILETTLREDKETYIGAFMQSVSFTTTVDSQRYDQVKIDFTRPRAARGQPIAQLAEPNRMLSITTSDVSRRLPVYSIGLEIADQAAAAATLDLVGLAIREHAIEERAYQVMRDFKNLIQGSVDTGDSALSANLITAYDSSIAAAGVMTQKAWVKFLRSNWMKRNIDWVFGDLDTYLAVEGRSGRPTRDTEPATDSRLNTLPNMVLPGIPGSVKFFPLEDSTILGTNGLLGMDSTKGMRRVMYVAANYSATEAFVLRRSQVMRMDWSERIERLGYDDAFQRTTLSHV